MTYKVCYWDAEAKEQRERDTTPEEVAEIEARKNAPPQVPQVVTMRQFRAALIELDMDQEIEAFLSTAPGKDGRRARADYVSATEVERDWPLMLTMADAMGKTPSEIDAVMTLAATL